MPLPFPEVEEEEKFGKHGKSFELRRHKKKVSVKQFTNLLVTIANFYEMDCPKGGYFFEFPFGELSAAHQSMRAAKSC